MNVGRASSPIWSKTKTRQWIFGMLIGAAPFLLIVICWAFVSFCANSLAGYYRYTKTRHRPVKIKFVDKNAIPTVPV
jgi:hypothetical protein